MSLALKVGLSGVPGIRPASPSLYERLVDLQALNRKLPEIAEIRLTGAKVVDCERHAQLVERCQFFVYAISSAHQEAFGQLEFEIARIEARSLKSLNNDPRNAD